MPPRKQPAPLLALCQNSVATHLASTCRMLQVAAQESPAAQVLALARRRLRPRFLTMLPGSIRADLLERTSRLLAAPAPDGSATAGSGPAPLYLLALLFAPDVKHLRVELCCYYGCSHQAALLKLLAAEGAGLRSLELARSALLRLDRGLLRAALASATQLRKLVLRNIAGDAVLQVVGACCPNLEVLDVAHSRQVTDTGIRGLLVNVELLDKSENQEGGMMTSPPTPPVSWSKLKLLARIVPWLRGDARHGKRDQRVLLQYCERRTALCQTLLTLDVANTGVTCSGVLLALRHAPNLQSLGEYAHTGRALEVLEKARASSASPPGHQPITGDNVYIPNIYALTTARSCRTNPRRLELLGRCCPSLRSLVLLEPRLPAHALRLLPENLSHLGLHALPADPALVSALYAYLHVSGASLNDLAIRFANPATQGHEDFSLAPVLDLAQVVGACSRLRCLAVDNAAVVWGEEGTEVVRPEHHPHQQQREMVSAPCLQTVQLGRVTAACALTALLPRAPELRVLHLHQCPDLASTHLGYVARHGQKLECFYVYEARQVASAAAVNTLISSCRNLLRLGNFGNWGLDCDGTRAVHGLVRANNLQLELHSGAHWFSSPCIRSFSS